MRKEIGDWSTVLFLEGDEAKEICKLGQGEACCPFLVGGGDGFECWKMNYPASATIHSRIDKGSMNAKGEGCTDEKWGSLRDSC